MTARQALLFLVLSFCSVDFAGQFDFLPSGTSISLYNITSISLYNITQIAILRKTAEVCRDIAASEGRNFNLNINDNLTVDEVQRACSPSDSTTTPISSFNFQSSISLIILHNLKVDFDFPQSEYHFHNEAFQEGRNVITTGVTSVKGFVRNKNYAQGRRSLGLVLHVLQDFYIHSNWVELGNKAPYSALIRPDEPLTNLAGPSTPTCRNCTGDNCTNNILPDVLQQRLLTSGYFSISSSAKPSGKCSHGGPFDRTSRQDPVGGISKDNVESSHGSFHQEAAALAVDASMELLEDIRLAAGDENFLRFMGISQANVLCFVIDTTGSMSIDILVAQAVANDIINSRIGTQQEPSAYILVPFNDPDFGPVTVTTNPDVFKSNLSQLSANGGGDEPELALSGLRLALTAAPPSSEIFVFTDASAKDAQLKDTVIALIESTKCVVNFLFTPLFGGNIQLYQELAQASGGLAIKVSKFKLSRAVDVIKDSSTSAVVTVFQVVRNPGNPATFAFTVDDSLGNMIAYITGASSLSFSLTSPTGVSQSSSQSSGPLGSFTSTENFHRLSLNTENQTGLWKIRVNSNDPYSVKVTGQSSLNFIYNLVEEEEGAHGNFCQMEGRVVSGGKATVLISLTGNVTTSITEVSLMNIAGTLQINGSKLVGSNIHLATFTGVPKGEFVILLKGEARRSPTSAPSSFQRQGTTQIKTCEFSVKSQPTTAITEPGSNVSIPFTIRIPCREDNDSVNVKFTVQANNDRNYPSTSPDTTTVEAGSGGVANGTVTLTVPPSAEPGTDVTVTIEATNAATRDLNYIVQRFAVAREERLTPSVTPPAPVTPSVTTPAPVTPSVTPPAPVTSSVTTPAPVTSSVTTPAPVTSSVTTPAPVTSSVTTPAPVTPSVMTPAPVTSSVTTPAPVTSSVMTPAPVTSSVMTPAPVTSSVTTPATVTPSVTTLSQGEQAGAARDWTLLTSLVFSMLFMVFVWF